MQHLYRDRCTIFQTSIIYFVCTVSSCLDDPLLIKFSGWQIPLDFMYIIYICVIYTIVHIIGMIKYFVTDAFQHKQLSSLLDILSVCMCCLLTSATFDIHRYVCMISATCMYSYLTYYNDLANRCLFIVIAMSCITLLLILFQFQCQMKLMDLLKVTGANGTQFQ